MSPGKRTSVYGFANLIAPTTNSSFCYAGKPLRGRLAEVT
jgi:hypothetical protein